MTDKDIVGSGLAFLVIGTAVWVAAIFVLGGCAAAFWNCFAADFGLHEATYKNGCGLAGFIVCCRFLFPPSRD